MKPKTGPLAALLCLGLSPGAAPAFADADLAPAPRYSVGTSPLTLFSETRTDARDRGIGLEGEAFFSDHASARLVGTYTNLFSTSFNLRTESLESGVRWYRWPGTDSWLLSFDLAYTSTDERDGANDFSMRTFDPDVTAGYRWVYRHGGYLCLAGGGQYNHVASATGKSGLPYPVTPKLDFGMGLIIK